MIRSDSELRSAKIDLENKRARLRDQREALKRKGLDGDVLKTALEPLEEPVRSLEHEIGAFERTKQGSFGELKNLREFGRLLVSIRVARGVSQGELAARLGVDPSQVSRDERTEYSGVTVERANRTLEALGADLRSRLTGARERGSKTARSVGRKRDVDARGGREGGKEKR